MQDRRRGVELRGGPSLTLAAQLVLGELSPACPLWYLPDTTGP